MSNSVLSALIALVALMLVAVIASPRARTALVGAVAKAVAHIAAPVLPAVPHTHTPTELRQRQAQSFRAYYTMCLVKSPRRRGVRPYAA